MTRLTLALAAALGLPLAAAPRLLLHRTATGLQFSEVEVLQINGKDSLRRLGAKPELPADPGKLPQEKILSTALLLRHLDSGVFAELPSSGNPAFFAPDGLDKKAALTAPKAWEAAAFSLKRNKTEKTPTLLNSTSVLALLPAGDDALADFCNHRAAFELLAGKDKAFALQMEVFREADRAYGKTEAMLQARAAIEHALRDGLERFESGNGGLAALNQALEALQISDQVYSADPRQKPLRDSVARRKAWLDRRLAILRSLYSINEWDAFLAAYRGFELYQWDFEDLIAARKKALAASLELHREAGRKWLAAKDYKYAVAEYRRALQRDPRSNALRQELSTAWSDFSLEQARLNQGRAKPLSAGQRDSINRLLGFAESYRLDNKLDEALKNVDEASAIDANALSVLLKKAEILGARNELGAAIAALDQADLIAVDEDRQRVSQLRTAILFKLERTKTERKPEIQKLIDAFSFHRAHSLALDALKADPTDPDFLFFAGFTSLAVHRRAEGASHLRRYLDSSDTVDADPARRRAVNRLIESITQTPEAATNGAPNWMSGAAVPAGSLYDPVSLAFQPRVDSIRASKKMNVRFAWDAARLRSITTSWEGTPSGAEKPFYFAYDPTAPQVRLIANAEIEKKAEKTEAPRAGLAGILQARKTNGHEATVDPDEAVKGSTLILLNNPYLDPAMVELFTGQRVAFLAAGNRFFHPFVWDRLFQFQASYDSAGRVAIAREVPDPATPSTPIHLEFEWNGPRLAAITGYEQTPQGRGRRLYERRLSYSGNRLTQETISYQGKQSRIEYKYTGDRLTTATCGEDPSLDNRSREVSFLN